MNVKKKLMSEFYLKLMLFRCRNRKVGILEKLFLKIKGYFDGKLGLIRETKADDWASPYTDYIVNGYLKHSEKIWGYFQVSVSGLLSTLGILVDRITALHLQIDEVDGKIMEYSEKNPLDVSRKAGEEHLPEHLIVARRNKEYDKRLAPLKLRKEKLEAELESTICQAAELRNILYENCNSIRSICTCQREHSRQCIDVYWQSAMISHPQSKEIPVIPHVIFSDNAEERYFSFHEYLNSTYCIPELIHHESETGNSVLATA